jgi:UDP-glucose 4-epimerase
MRVVVTGATGFIGSHVAVRLARAGHAVVATGRDPAKVPALGEVAGISLDRLELGEPSSWHAPLRGADVLVHVALGWGDTGPQMLAADTTASIGLFEAARRAGVKRAIYTSSTAANGEMEPTNAEERQPRPTDLYGATKAATEMYARAYARQQGLPIHVVRPGYVFGEPVVPGARSQPDGRFRTICEAVREGRPVRLVQHDGTQFLHAADLAEVYLKLLEDPAPFTIRYALSRDWVSWEQIARWAMEAVGRTVPLELEDRGSGAEPYRFDVSRLERELGLSFGNAERLRAHVRWELGRGRPARG